MMVLNPPKPGFDMTATDRLLEFNANSLSPSDKDLNTVINRRNADFYITHSDEEIGDENKDQNEVKHIDNRRSSEEVEINVSPDNTSISTTDATTNDDTSEDDFLLVVPQRQRTYALGARDMINKNKRSTICVAEATSNRRLHDDSSTPALPGYGYGYLSKSWSNLKCLPDENHNHHHHSKTHHRWKKMPSMFSLRGSNTSINTLIEQENRYESITKSRTPSLFRKFSHKLPEIRRASADAELRIPVVNISCADSLKKARSFSLQSSTKNFGTLPADALHREEHTGMKLSHPRSFPILRSPFARPKHDKSNIDMRKKVYNEMLQSIQDNNCKRLKLLIRRRRTDINTTEHSLSLIHEAAFKGCVKCLKGLIKNGWSVNYSDESGWRPLHAACIGGSLDAVKVLLSYGADPNSITTDGLSPLHFAVSNNDLYSTHALMQNNGDPLIQSHFSETPFQLAINLKRELVLEYMMMQSCFLVNGSF